VHAGQITEWADVGGPDGGLLQQRGAKPCIPPCRATYLCTLTSQHDVASRDPPPPFTAQLVQALPRPAGVPGPTLVLVFFQNLSTANICLQPLQAL
jgi:hypothetical protein